MWVNVVRIGSFVIDMLRRGREKTISKINITTLNSRPVEVRSDSLLALLL